MPDDESANLLMVGVGTGIAPFRAFIRHIAEERRSWRGQVRLFYGANTGMELLYRNEYNKDLGLYYDYATFKAFDVVSSRPHFDVPPDIDRLIEENLAEVWKLVRDPKTYVFVAGLIDVEHKFYKAMSKAAGSEAAWRQLRERLVSDGRYAELLYE
jgi:ferredoxin--NADP+ reductase